MRDKCSVEDEISLKRFLDITQNLVRDVARSLLELQHAMANASVSGLPDEVQTLDVATQTIEVIADVLMNVARDSELQKTLFNISIEEITKDICLEKIKRSYGQEALPRSDLSGHVDFF